MDAATGTRARRRAIALLASLGFIAAACDRAPVVPCEGCNLVLISLDTLRADHLSAYGYERPTSPTLERLASEGVLFEHFYQNGGGTLPSHMSLMTSLTPLAHGIDPSDATQLPDARVTLAEALREQGYATAAFVDAGFMMGHYGFAQGFDRYDDAGGRFAAILPKVEAWLGERAVPPAAGAAPPFFLFVHSYDIHSETEQRSYECPGDYPDLYTEGLDRSFDGCRDGLCASEFLERANAKLEAGELAPSQVLTPAQVEYTVALYDGCINYADAQVGRLLETLRNMGLLEKSVVVVTSDHGEEFLEHGRLIHLQNGYDEIGRIPLILRFPKPLGLAGVRVRHLAAMVDLAPTLLAIVGAPPLAQAQGVSLLPAILWDDPVRDDLHMYYVLRTPTHKYFHWKQQLFHMGDDPQERHPRAIASDRYSRRIEVLVDVDRAERAAFEARFGQTPRAVELDEEQAAQLRALGYGE